MTVSITSGINLLLPLPHPGDPVLHQDHEHPVEKNNNVRTICQEAVLENVYMSNDKCNDDQSWSIIWRVQWQNVYHFSLGADHPHSPTNSLRTLECQTNAKGVRVPGGETNAKLRQVDMYSNWPWALGCRPPRGFLALPLHPGWKREENRNKLKGYKK